MYEEEFQKRLHDLRIKKNISARDMSLSIGQNPSYIHFIETGKSMPSMSAFLFICDYLGVTPAEFFDLNSQEPTKLRQLITNLKKLDLRTFNNISELVETIAK